MAQDRTDRHWRAQLELTFADDPRYDPPTTTRRYSAWIAADSEEKARALLDARVAEVEDLVRWRLIELVDATNGEAEVVALWDGF